MFRCCKCKDIGIPITNSRWDEKEGCWYKSYSCFNCKQFIREFKIEVMK